MSRVERHPGTFGLKRPVRSVSMGQAWADALLARAQQGNPGVGGRPDSQVPGWASNAVNSTLGGILGQGSLPETQRAAAEWAAQGLSLPTPGGAMRQEGTVNAIDTALNLVRPLALADVGVAGAAGSMMFPFPGLAPGAAPAARTARRAGGGIAGALRQLLSRGGDEAALRGADEAVEATVRTGVTRPLLETVDELAETAPAFHTSGTYDAVSGRSIFNEPMYHGRATNPTSFDDPALQGTRLGRDVTRQGGGLPGVWTSTELQTARGYSGESGGFVHAVTWEPDRAPRVAHLWEPIPDDLRGVLRTEIEALDEAGDLLAKVDNPQIKLGEITTDQRLPVPLIQQALQGRVDVLVDYHGFLWLNPSDLRIAATASNITRPRPGPPLLG